MNGPPPGLVAALVDGPSIVRAVEWHDVIESTNARAAQLARDGAAEGQLVLSDVQTAGRGRQGRGWVAPPGTSLMLSLLLRPRVAVDRVSTLPLLVGLAMAEAVEPFVGRSCVMLKWPNDLLVHGGKAAGVLVEGQGGAQDAEPLAAVVGVGLNVDWRAVDRPPELAGASSLAEAAGTPIDRWRVLAAFIGVLGNRYAAWQDAPTAFLSAYEGRCATLNERVRAERAPQGPALEGRAAGIAADGALEIIDDTGVLHIVRAGDVHHIRPAPA